MFLNFVTTVNVKKNLDLNLDLYLKKIKKKGEIVKWKQVHF